jgi:hypothetical protein
MDWVRRFTAPVEQGDFSRLDQEAPAMMSKTPINAAAGPT